MEKVITTQLSLFLLNFLIYLTHCCYPGIESIGVVSPLGDIVSKVGDDIVINCTLNDDYDGPATAKDIRWRRNSTKVPLEFISLINNQTAQLKLINTTMEDSGYYSCYIDIGEQSTVCNNDVRIGYPPSSAINISCLSRNWENLTCTWSPPYNPVRTKWSFYYRMSKYRLECPEYLNDRTGCFFSEKTTPAYRQAAKIYYFFLEGENRLGLNKTNYMFAHFEEVLPNPPSNLVALEVNSHQLNLKWSSPYGMQLFPPQLFYQLHYYSEWDQIWKVEQVGLNITNYTLYNLIPNTNYTFKVLCRSGASEHSPWSNPSYVWKRTPSDVPGLSPNVTSAGFEQRKSLLRRDIFIHWQAIPKLFENGDNISYVIDALEDGLQRNLAIQELSHTSALIINLELEKIYIFRLRVQNEKGLSPHISYLTVHKASQILPAAEVLNVISFEDGVYELSWKLGNLIDVSEITNVTLFWCEVQKKTFSHHCYDSNIFWRTLPRNTTSLNLTLSDNINYDFAISLNSGRTSSGMIWHSCIVPYNGMVGKMKSVSVLHISKCELQLRWTLDCNDRRGVITGYNIYYCIYDVVHQKCHENETYLQLESDPYAKKHRLSKLKPYTTYKVTVSALTRVGEGEESDPIINTTKEAEPEDSPNLTLSEVTNSSVAVIVQNPEIPNGIIREFRFYVDDNKWESIIPEGLHKFWLTNLKSYRNYSIHVVACTLGDMCSPPSSELSVRTEIGIPSPPSITDLKLFNVTHMRIEWEDPVEPNGPILKWVISLAWEDSESDNIKKKDDFFTEDGSRFRFIPLPIPCESSNDLQQKDPEYNLSIRAQTLRMDGLQSKVFVTRPCSLRGNEVIPFWGIAIISVAVMFVFLCMFFLFSGGIKRLKRKVKEMKNIKVQLPKGLDSPNVMSLNHYPFKPYPYTNGHAKENLRLPLSPHENLTLTSDSGSADGHDPRYSTSSIDELLYVMKGPNPPPHLANTRLLSGDSGCSSGQGSLSSSMTGRTHLSIDSGTDMELPVSPSHDSVFATSPWKKTEPEPVATSYESSSDPFPPPHYSRVADRAPAIHNNYLSRQLKEEEEEEEGEEEEEEEDPEMNSITDIGNQGDDDGVDDYLQPIILPPQILTVAHVTLAFDEPQQHNERSPPAIPPKPKRLETPLHENLANGNDTRDNEAGYAKLGLSRAAFQNKCDKQMEGFLESPIPRCSPSSSFSYLPTRKVEMVGTPIAYRTLRQSPEEANTVGRCASEASAKGGFDGELITLPAPTIPPPPPPPGTRKCGYVTLDDMRNGSAAQQVSEPATRYSTETCCLAGLPPSVNTSSSVYPWQRETAAISPRLPEGCPKTYV